jgi:CheY-like chemotaxis protein
MGAMLPIDKLNIKSVKSVLIIDDDRQFVKLVRDNLMKEGYTVHCGYDGHMAVTLAEAHRPDLILMDVNMPYMNGFKTFERLRAQEKTARIPVIFISEMVSQTVAPIVDASPRAAYLKKPVDLVDLSSLMRQFLVRYAA